MSGLAIILVILAAVFICALALHAYKHYKIRLRQRMNQNEYDVAVTIWDYARLVKRQIDEAVREGTGVLDFTKMSVPHSKGYFVSLELMGSNFRVYATPDRYAKTGKLSFFADNTLAVRAADRAGEQATSDDPEYTGDSID
jgi:hypothetical protein